MDADTEAYPIDYSVTYDEHLDCKQLEKKKETPTMENEAYMRSMIKKMKRKFVHARNMVVLSKNNYFFLVYEKAIASAQAATNWGCQ